MVEITTPCVYEPAVESAPFIYGLVDLQEPKHVRYVGMAMKTGRPFEHARHARQSIKHSHLFHWIRQLQSNGREPSILLLERLPRSAPRSFVGQIERMYISSLRVIGHRLTNVAEGGFGGATRSGQRHTPEARQKIRDAHLGVPKSKAHREALSAAKLGKPGPIPSEELRVRRGIAISKSERFRAAMKSELRSERIAAGQRGRVHTELQEAKRLAAHAATVARIIEEKGQFRSNESLEKAGASIRAALAARTPEQKQAQIEKRRATIAAKKRLTDGK